MPVESIGNMSRMRSGIRSSPWIATPGSMTNRWRTTMVTTMPNSPRKSTPDRSKRNSGGQEKRRTNSWKTSCIQKTLSVGNYQIYYQKNRINIPVISIRFLISHYQIYYHFSCFWSFTEKNTGFTLYRKILIAKPNARCYNRFAVAAWRNGRRTALKMRRETVSVQVRLPLLRLPGIPWELFLCGAGDFAVILRGDTVCLGKNDPRSMIRMIDYCCFCWYNGLRKTDKRNAEPVYKQRSADGRLTFELNDYRQIGILGARDEYPNSLLRS